MPMPGTTPQKPYACVDFLNAYFIGCAMAGGVIGIFIACLLIGVLLIM